MWNRTIVYSLSSKPIRTNPGGSTFDVIPQCMKTRVRPFGNGLMSTAAEMLSVTLLDDRAGSRTYIHCRTRVPY